jgi:hypothetical protein
MEGSLIDMNFKRATKIACFFILPLLLLTPIPASAGNQGLSWGVQIGERREFKLVRDRNSTIFGHTYINEVVTLEITENPVIPDNITVLTSFYGDPRIGLPYIERMGYWENGTDMGMWAYLFVSPVVMPVGNWSLIASLISNNLNFTGGYTTELIDTPQLIGYRYSYSEVNFIDFKEVWWNKTDGMLVHYHLHEYDTRFEGLEKDHNIWIDIVQDSFPWATTLLIAVPVSAVLIIGVAVIIKRRSQKASNQAVLASTAST